MTVADLKRAVRDARRPRVVAPAPDVDPLASLSRWFVTSKQVAEMTSTRLVFGSSIAASHLAVWAAPGNGGKTSVAMHAAAELAPSHRVLFFQEDAPAGDLPRLFHHAAEHRYQLLNSTLAGTSTEEQVRVLQRLVKESTPLEGVVMFFDTLKKYADLMSKGGARAFFKLMRALTQRGATIVLLGHTNKHRGVDGKLMFEGVGDVRNDVDELIYLDATEKDPRGVVTITMRPDKTRSAVVERTFELDTTTMRVRALDHVVNVAAIRDRQAQLKDDAPLVAEVRVALSMGGLKYTDLREQVVRNSGKPRSAVEKVIERYLSADVDDPDALWIETRLRLNNVRHIALKPRVS